MEKYESPSALWIAVGSALTAGVFGLLGVLVGSGIAAAQADRAVTAQRELAAREDMITATSEFDGATEVLFDNWRAEGKCLSESRDLGQPFTMCQPEIDQYSQAYFRSQTALSRVAYFSPSEVYEPAAAVFEAFPGTLRVPSSDGTQGPSPLAVALDEYLALRQEYGREVCEAINPFGNASCVGWNETGLRE